MPEFDGLLLLDMIWEGRTQTALGMLEDGVVIGRWCGPAYNHYGSRVTGLRGDDNRALHCAALTNNPVLYVALVKHGADPSARNYNNRRPYQLIPEGSKKGFCSAVVDSLPENHSHLDDLLLIAVHNRWYDLVRTLFEKGAKSNFKNEGVITQLVREVGSWLAAHKYIVRHVIERQPELGVAYDSVSPFQLACQLGRWESAEFIVQASVEARRPIKDGSGLGLYLAAKAEQWPLVERLLRENHSGATYIDPQSQVTALHYAALANNAVVFHLLVEAGADAAFEKQLGSDVPSVLHFAKTLEDNEGLIETLILCGANLAGKINGALPFSQVELSAMLQKAMVDRKLPLVSILLTFMIQQSNIVVSEELLAEVIEFFVSQDAAIQSKHVDFASKDIVACLSPVLAVAQKFGRMVIQRLVGDVVNKLSVKSQLFLLEKVVVGECVIPAQSVYWASMSVPTRLQLISAAADREMPEVFKHLVTLVLQILPKNRAREQLIKLCQLQMELANTLTSYASGRNSEDAVNREQKGHFCLELLNRVVLPIKAEFFKDTTRLVADIGRPLLGDFLKKNLDLLKAATQGATSRVKELLNQLSRLLGMPVISGVSYTANLLVGSAADAKRKVGIQRALQKLQAIHQKYESDYAKGSPTKRAVCAEFIGYLSAALDDVTFRLKYRVDQLNKIKLTAAQLKEENDKGRGKDLSLGATRWDAATRGLPTSDMNQFFEMLRVANYFPGYAPATQGVEMSGMAPGGGGGALRQIN